MKLERNHSFGADEGLARLQALTSYWTKKYGVQINWNGNRARIDGKVKGVKFNGTVTVEEGRVLADIQAGFLAEKLGGRAYVEHKLESYLDPNQSIEQLRALGA